MKESSVSVETKRLIFEEHIEAISHPTVEELPMVTLMETLMAFRESYFAETDNNKRGRLCTKAETISGCLYFLPGTYGRLHNDTVWAYGQSVVDEIRQDYYGRD